MAKDLAVTIQKETSAKTLEEKLRPAEDPEVTWWEWQADSSNTLTLYGVSDTWQPREAVRGETTVQEKVPISRDTADVPR